MPVCARCVMPMAPWASPEGRPARPAHSGAPSCKPALQRSFRLCHFSQELVQSVFNYHLHGGEPPALPQPGAAESTAAQTKASDKEKPKATKTKPTLAEDEEHEEEQENAPSQEPPKPSKSSKKKKADDEPARAIKKAKPTGAAESRRANAAKAEESKVAMDKADKDKAEAAKLSRAARVRA